MASSALSLAPEASTSQLINRPPSPANSDASSRRNRRSLTLDMPSSAERAPLLRTFSNNGELLSVHIDRPSTPGIAQSSWLSHPRTSTSLEYRDADNLPLTPGGSTSFVAHPRGGPIPEPTLFSRIRLFFLQLYTNALSTFFLILIVIWALSSRTLAALLDIRHWNKSFKRDWDRPDKWKDEELTKDVKYYAESCGYKIIDQTVETEDGYLLRVHKVVVPGRENHVKVDGRGGWPVIIQHGLFQTSGSFVTSEERSLAFWLAEHGGYQVYLSNSRAVFDMGHRTLSRSDPRFWDYNIRELALYDLPAVIAHVKRETAYDKVAFIGHSQGNATMFCTLARGMFPQIGESLSLFVALAPAVYAGPLTTGFPFGLIKNMEWSTWKRVFGVLDFIPMMRYAYNLVPGKPFGLLGYQIFAFLFINVYAIQWTDKNWFLKRRKAKMFRFTPSPVSSAGIFWWTGKNGFSSRGCVLDQTVTQWFDKSFPPLSLYHGGKDYLVLTEPLLERIRTHEPHVKLLRVDRLETAILLGEHCDSFWHVDAPELTYGSLLHDIESTRDPYPEEQLDRR